MTDTASQKVPAQLRPEHGHARERELFAVAERLRQSLATHGVHFQLLIDHIPLLIYLRNRAGYFLRVNEFFAETFGLDKLSARQAPISELAQHHPGLEVLLQGDEPCFQSSTQRCPQEMTLTDTHGIQRIFQAHKLRNVPCDDDPHALLCIAADITHYRHAELAQQIAGLGYWGWDIASGQLEWSEEIYRIFALDPAHFQASYDTFIHAVHPDDRARVNAAVRHALQENQPYRIDHRIVHPDGAVRIVHEQGIIEQDEQGQARYMLGTVLDITEQKRAEEALKAIAGLAELSASADFFRTCATHLSHTYNCDYVYIGIFADKGNSRIRTLVFKQDEQFIDNIEYALAGTPCKDVLDHKLEFIASGAAAKYPDDHFLEEMGIESYFGAPLIDSGNTVIGIAGVLGTRTIALNPWNRPVLGIYAKRIALELERQTQLDTLRQTEEFLDKIIESMPLLLYVKDIESRHFIRINRAVEALIGQPRQAIIGKDDNNLFEPELARWHAQLEHQAIESKSEVEVPSLPLQTKTQGLRQMHLQLFPILDARGEAECLVGLAEDITEQENLQKLLHKTLATQQAIFNSAKVSIISTDLNGMIQSFNTGAEHMLGYRAHEVVGRNTPVMFHDPQEIAAHAARLNHEQGLTIGNDFEAFVAMARRGIPEEREWTYLHKDGHRIPVLLSVTAMFDDEQQLCGFLGIATDISPQKQAEAELRLLASVFDNSIEGIMITDPEGTILRVNQAFSDITGYSAHEAIGQTPRLLSSDRHSKAFYDNLWHEVAESGTWRGEIWNRRKDGEVFPGWSNISGIRDASGNTTRYVFVFTDISEKKLSEERIHHLAHYDVITNLPNRTLYNERLEQALLHAQRQRLSLAVMYLDLDGFKLINDTLGHLTGDELLQQVAQRLQSCVRSADTIARLGGDEFAILLTELAQRTDVATVAEKVLSAISKPYHLGMHDTLISASIGISVYPGDGEDVTTLIRHADTAMYKAKEKGKNTYRYYTHEMNEVAIEHLTLRNELRLALERDELELHYQPQVDLHSGRIYAVEALTRWIRPDGSRVAPSQFIPIAEESGFIIPLGIWVLRQACTQLRAWHQAGYPYLRMAINLSRRQFSDPELVNNVRSILKETSVDPHQLEFEITESFLMENAQQTAQVLHQFKAMGIEISIDDFGIAYSSLSQLKHFNIDRLKIDRSFINDLPHDSDDQVITSAIIAMAHRLKLRVIAEGVENHEQLHILNTQSCDEIQGYLFSPPLAADVMLDLIREGKNLYHLK